MITITDLDYLKITVDLAKTALDKGNSPFGSILVLDNKIIYKGHNENKDGDNTRHPEYDIAKYAINNITLDERKRAIVYTSGEHCPMCSAAHAWAGLGKIVYAYSSKQLNETYTSLNFDLGNVKSLSINEVINNTEVIGPHLELYETITNLHKKYILSKRS